MKPQEKIDRKRELELILPKICSNDTSQSHRKWNARNPFLGHCAIVAVLVQDILKGDILWSSLEGTGWHGNHYWNRLPNGEEVDFTKNQFGKNPPILKGKPRNRSFILSSKDTKSKYQTLFNRYMSKRAKLFGK